MFNFEIIENPNFKIENEIIKNILKNIEKIVNKKLNGTLNIVFLNDEKIRELNKKYRKVDKSTDVLSFHYFDNFGELKKEEIAGEIIISKDKIISQAKKYKITKQEEFYKLVIHSTLHILGYDHETEEDYEIMQKLENKIQENTIGKILQ